MSSGHYIGQELDIFARAVQWKRYWSTEIRSYLVGDVLEVGAGLGTNTGFLKTEVVNSWTCLEPDANLAERMRQMFAAVPRLADCRIETGTVDALGSSPRFDAVLYIDVLEHIERDREELKRAALLLREGGNLIVLAPAHQWLYTPFDRAVGHVRRYDRKSLVACSPEDCELVQIVYLDAAGAVASLGNLLLGQSMPTLKQILFWDRFLVKFSRVVDRLTLHRIGKSILGVWRKQ